MGTAILAADFRAINGTASFSRACARIFLQQPSSEMLYIGRFHRTRSGQVLGESSFANPFKLRDCSNIEECLCLFRNYLRCRPDFPQCLGALSGKRLTCHFAVEDWCHADVLIAEFSRFFDATLGPFVAVWATSHPTQLPRRLCTNSIF